MLLFYVENSEFNKTKELIDKVRISHPSKRTQIGILQEMLNLINKIVEEDFSEIERSAQKLNQQDPDNVAFANLVKLSRALPETYQRFRKLTPKSKLTAPELKEVQEQFKNIKKFSDQTVQLLQKTFEDSFHTIFGLPETYFINTSALTKSISGHSSTLECAIN